MKERQAWGREAPLLPVQVIEGQAGEEAGTCRRGKQVVSLLLAPVGERKVELARRAKRGAREVRLSCLDW